MSALTRTFVLLATAAGALTVAIASLVMMLIPTIDAPPSSLIGHLGAGVEFALSLTGALAALLVTVFALIAQLPARRASATGFSRAAALVSALLLAVSTPGGIIPAAGYTFAMTVIVGSTVLVVLIALRRPWLGILLAAVVIGVVVYAGVSLESAPVVPQVIGTLGTMLPHVGLALAHVVAAAGLLIWTIGESSGARGGFARAVLRHRRALTIVAAACALPYVFTRATWLTPWPLFGGSAELFAQEPATRVVGLALGAGMLAGGVLTMGLILPWGERFPRLFAGVGGRPVPPGLAIIPASVVSVLFTAAGIQFALEGAGSIDDTLYLLLMFPFWLWGPLLAIATWGYAMNRMATLTAPALALSESRR